MWTEKITKLIHPYSIVEQTVTGSTRAKHNLSFLCVDQIQNDEKEMIFGMMDRWQKEKKMPKI